MSWIITISLIFFSVLSVFVTKLVFSKFLNGSCENEKASLVKKTNESLKKLDSMFEKSDELISKLQLNTISIQYNEAQNLLTAQKERLEEVEASLKVAKKKMEEKEILQQELKTSKEEDEKELQLLLNDYEKNSNESRELEKVLANQMKALDDYAKNQEYSVVLRDFFNALNETLEESSSNLRSVISEYEQMYERLSALKQQLTDLEVEYSKLIESKLQANG